jgi:hypothetical protein
VIFIDEMEVIGGKGARSKVIWNTTKP